MTVRARERQDMRGYMAQGPRYGGYDAILPERNYTEKPRIYTGGRARRFFLKMVLWLIVVVVVCAFVDYADYDAQCSICGAHAPFEITITGHRVNAAGSMLEKVIDTCVDFARDNTETVHFCTTHYTQYMEWMPRA